MWIRACRSIEVHLKFSITSTSFYQTARFDPLFFGPSVFGLGLFLLYLHSLISSLHLFSLLISFYNLELIFIFCNFFGIYKANTIIKDYENVIIRRKKILRGCELQQRGSESLILIFSRE
jgi:hypothetical protein